MSSSSKILRSLPLRAELGVTGGAVPEADGAPGTVGNSDDASLPTRDTPAQVVERIRTLRKHMRPCNLQEKKFAQLVALRSSFVSAYREAYNKPDSKNTLDYQQACRLAGQPWVREMIRELESAAASACVINTADLLQRDRDLVEAAKRINELTSHVIRCCRYCYGVGHAYQWIDNNEFAVAMAANFDANAARESMKPPQPPLPMPTDEGGYGFDVHSEPCITCTKCEGSGVQVTIYADTTKLDGIALTLFRGMRETKNGKEMLLHDVDKAMDRLYRATGLYGDDAASVARGAAAGAASGAVIAAAAAQRVQAMDEDQARRLYLELVS